MNENLNQLKQLVNGEKVWKTVADALQMSEDDDAKEKPNEEVKKEEVKPRKPKTKVTKDGGAAKSNVKLPKEMGNMEIDCNVADIPVNGYVLVPCVTINVYQH